MSERKFRTACRTALSMALLFVVASCTSPLPQTFHQRLNAPLPNIEQPVRVSFAGVDAAEPAIAAAGDGSIYVVWIEHRAKEADVMVRRFDRSGQPLNPPVRVNPKPGRATAWRGDPPTIAVAPDETLYVGWTGLSDSSPHANDLYLLGLT